jgi:hypothetical protein
MVYYTARIVGILHRCKMAHNAESIGAVADY